MALNEASTSRPAPIGGVGPLGLGDTIEYRNFTNMSGPQRRGYQPGDTLVAGWIGTVEIDNPSTISLPRLAEQVFEIHNRADRPDGQLCASMSVGDVVIVGETALTVEREGFSVCQLDPADLVTAMTYRQYLDHGPLRQ